MKKLDTDFEDAAPGIEDGDGENFPTAVYTVYNIHGEPIGHRLYSYQPFYEPEDEILEHEDTTEYHDTEESDDIPSLTILRGGIFDEHETENSIDRLKHQYFERYVDKRRKRFLNKSSEEKKELEEELQSVESTTETVTKAVTKARKRRGVNFEEFDRDFFTKPTDYFKYDLSSDLLKVIPLTTKNDGREFNKEVAVIPLQYNRTNSTEIDNILDKRDKRTSRKTDRLNQTTATVPKT